MTQDSGNEAVPFLSYAQNAEDVVLWRALGCVVDSGTYVDVGAADPVVDSVTAAFYDRGWSGLNVEPVPEYAAALRAARPRDTVVERGAGSAAGVFPLTVFEGTGWSTFDNRPPHSSIEGTPVRRIEVEVNTLDEILDGSGFAERQIHFLKVDVEGLEEAVLQGIDLSRRRPWVVVVESTEPGSTVPTHDRWEHLLTGAHYRFCLFDGLNRFYAAEEHPDVAERLSYPACTFDQPYEQRHVRELRRLVGEARESVERRECELSSLRPELDRLAQEAARLTGMVHERAAELAAVRGDLAGAVAARDSVTAQFVHWRHDALLARTRQAEIGRAAHDYLVGRQNAERAYADLLTVVNNLEAEIAAVHDTVSWRITAPIRAVRRIRPRVAAEVGGSAPVAQDVSITSHSGGQSQKPTVDRASVLLESFLERLRRASEVILGEELDLDTSSVIEGAKQAFSFGTESDVSRAWLGLVSATSRFPDEDTVRAEARTLSRIGGDAYVDRLLAMFESAVQRGEARDVPLDVIRSGVIIDVTHTAQHDLQTGIQRVVRETTARWMRDHAVVPVWWDYGSNTLRRLDDGESERLANWRDHLPTEHGTELTIRSFDHTSDAIVVPWKSILLLPELTAEPARTGGYRALSCADVLHGISMIGYDIIPITAAETVTEAMSHVFSLYLSMVKHARRLSAISDAAANDFRAFNGALPSQGLSGPLVQAHLLPPSPAVVDDSELEAVAAMLGVGPLPMVLVVGSHEPRKNHLTVLEAAERLWSSGAWFDLVFIGGSGWRSEGFDLEIDRLVAAGRPVRVHRRATEAQLWGAYRLARFTVFPSLLEGYGLPIVESIASGTPVITSNYGSMAEVGRPGGALLVDPHDSVELEKAMRLLLQNDERVAELRREAAERTFPTWDQYAADVWQFLVVDAWES